MPGKKETTEVFNINKPGTSSFVQKDKYEEVKRVLKAFMPTRSPGLTQDEMASLVIDHVSEDVFDDRTKAGWWMKTVQLDLEARKTMIRENAKPLRWHYEIMKDEFLPPASEKAAIKKRKILELPINIKNAIVKENLLDAYLQRPLYQRNDYIHWIQSAKREETVNKRLMQMLAELRAGNVYMNMEYHRRKD